MNRRELITVLAATAVAPGPSLAQDAERKRRVGVLMNQRANDTLAQAKFGAFKEAFQDLGWTEGVNVSFEVRWGAPADDRFRKDAADLVALKPDVILASSGATMPAIMQATRTVPVVFVLVPDPVGSGFVESLARPGGNGTGFTLFDFGLSGKWLELLKELVPDLKRAAVLRDPIDPAGMGQFGAIRTAAELLGIEVLPVDAQDTAAIERNIKAFATTSKAGLIVTGSAPAGANRNLIITLANQLHLPAVYPFWFFAIGGGLISYGPDQINQYRRAAAYIDRILKGTSPAELPVQAPTRYELVVNMKTAKALGITVPPTLLARADEVIE